MLKVHYVIPNEVDFVESQQDLPIRNQVRKSLEHARSQGRTPVAELPGLPKRIASVGQGTIGVSTDGTTSLYSGGFSGCLGVIITATGGRKGGIVAHISQTGAIHGKVPEYFLDGVEGACKLWRTHFADTAAFDLLFFRGDASYDSKGEQVLELEDWERRVRARLKEKGVDGLVNVTDLRAERELASNFLLDTDALVLYPFSSGIPELYDHFGSLSEEDEARYVILRDTCNEHIVLEHGKEKNAKMPYKRYPI